MTSFWRPISQYLADDSGAVAVEYVVIAGALTLALVPGFYYVSSAMQAKFEMLSSSITE